MKTQNQNDKATARPWHVAHTEETRDTVSSYAGQVATISGRMGSVKANEREANAALIVEAVNSHAELLVALEKIVCLGGTSAETAIARAAIASVKN